jgi:transcriptional regulator with XRE-family HTH domain
MPNSNEVKHEWIKDGLRRRGYRQKDVATAFGSQQSSVSRFLAGEEMQDLPLSKAVPLAQMLGISLDELAKGLGFRGPPIEPPVETLESSPIPIGTINITTPAPGIIRVEMRKDLSFGAGQEILRIVSTDVVPTPAIGITG